MKTETTVAVKEQKENGQRRGSIRKTEREKRKTHVTP